MSTSFHHWKRPASFRCLFNLYNQVTTDFYLRIPQWIAQIWLKFVSDFYIKIKNNNCLVLWINKWSTIFIYWVWRSGAYSVINDFGLYQFRDQEVSWRRWLCSIEPLWTKYNYASIKLCILLLWLRASKRLFKIMQPISGDRMRQNVSMQFFTG